MDERYISPLTKPLNRALLTNGFLQPDLFDEDIGEVLQEAKRLITRRNEVRSAPRSVTP